MYNCYYGCIPVAPVIHGHNIVRVQDADVLRLSLAGLCDNHQSVCNPRYKMNGMGKYNFLRVFLPFVLVN